MRWINLDQITPEMVVAEDVTDESGQVLVAAGQRIPAGRSEILRRRGVERVAVESAQVAVVDPLAAADAAATAGGMVGAGAGARAADDARAQLVEARLARLRAMFVEHRAEQLMLELYRVACRVARGWGEEAAP